MRESQNESIISEAIASEKMVDDGERSGISNPFSKTSSSTAPRIREGMGGYKNQKQEDFVNKLLAKTPFYATKHTNHLCKGLNWEAQNSTLKDARKRFEMELLANKQKDMEENRKQHRNMEKTSRLPTLYQLVSLSRQSLEIASWPTSKDVLSR